MLIIIWSCVLVSFRCYTAQHDKSRMVRHVLVSFRCYAIKTWFRFRWCSFSFFSLLQFQCYIRLLSLFLVLVSFRCYESTTPITIKALTCFSFFSLLQSRTTEKLYTTKVLVSFRCYRSSAPSKFLLFLLFINIALP